MSVEIRYSSDVKHCRHNSQINIIYMYQQVSKFFCISRFHKTCGECDVKRFSIESNHTVGLCNQPLATLRQPHSIHSDSNSPLLMTGTSSIDSALSPSITPSVFHSMLKTSLFHKSFSPEPSVSSSGLTTWTPQTGTVTSQVLSIDAFLLFTFSFSHFFSFWFCAVD